MTSIYDAIMKAADHIESCPQEFRFMSTVTPEHPGCGTSGCAMGWIGTFAGLKGDFDVAANFLELPKERLRSERSSSAEYSFAFYNRMDDVFGGKGWKDSAALCAQALRLYASKYHGAAHA